MEIQRSLARKTSSKNPMRLRGVHRMFGREQMDMLIEVEVARVDRNGRYFTLVLFSLEKDSPEARHTWRLARAIVRRARMIDIVGWFDEQWVAVVLPETALDGAHRFAQDIADLVRDDLGEPLVKFYTYPDHWTDGAKPQDGAPSTPRRKSADRPTPTPTGSGREKIAAPYHPAAIVPGVKSEPLTALLARPLPRWKRALDIVGASAGLVAFSPLMLVAAVGIKWTMPGPVFFNQPRAGLGNKPFVMHKFRTMVVDAEAKKKELMKLNEQDGPAFKLTHDPRVTPFGRFLRKTSIDELPQLWNVLKGEMSIVGPRPLPLKEQAGCTQWQHRRCDVTPGLTCIWQTQGRSTVTFNEWVRMDIQYIRERTLRHDLKIIFDTVVSVLLRKGAR